ncbi:MAG: T9SS type A sorting domain-containing protein [Lentimicrobiaceae bacterium]|nr:T9SS type A sorting domain-containing protein [Lentimicrobiaceae bacterium]
MKKRLTVLTLFIALCASAFAQYQSHWGKPVTYETNTSSTIVLSIDDTNVGANIELGAFCGEELRGKAFLDEYDEVFYLMLQGQKNDLIEYRIYDHESQRILNFVSDDNTLTFIPEQHYDLEIHFYSVAKVGDLKYGSLQDAYNAAEDGDVITITNNTQGPGLVIDKDVTIDFNGKTYSFTEPVGSTGTESNGFQILAGNTVTLKNGGLNVAEEAADKFYILVQNYADLKVENMTLDGTYLDKWIEQYQDSYVLSNNSGKVNISNSTIQANIDGTKSFALDACKYEGYEAPVVTLAGDVVVNGNVELNGGQIYHTQTINGVAKKSFKGGQSYWGTISTPIANAVIPEATAGTHDLYRFDEPTMMWNYYDDDQNDYETLELGRGYLYANTDDVTVELKGAFNVSDVQFPLSYTENNVLAGFNMIGNPFSHNITNANMIPDVELAGGFYEISANGGFVAKTSGSAIAPMESVLVKANAKGGTLVINPTAISKRNTADNGVIAVNVSNSNYNDVAYVSFNEGVGLDKIEHRNAEIPMVFVPVNNKNYAIAMMEQDVTEIPVSFKAATMGEYTIGAEAQNCEYAMMTLVDRFTGVETNLLIEDYTFMATSNDNAERFIIKLAMSNSNDGDNENFAFINNGMMYIYNIEGQGVVSVYDVTGRPVAEYNVAESANISTSDFAAGVYIIRMTDENGVKVQKIVVE